MVTSEYIDILSNSLQADFTLNQPKLIICGVTLFVLAFLSGAILSSWVIAPTLSLAKKMAEFSYKGWNANNGQFNTTNTEDLSDISEDKIPKHIAVIMDGNRRYGREKHNDAIQGHWVGMQTFIDFVQWCMAYKVQTVTAYAFSTENWNRDTAEINALMQIFVNYAESFQQEAMARNVRVCVFTTDFSRLPTKVQRSVRELEASTCNNSGFTINFCLSYGGRADILSAAKQLCAEVRDKGLSPDDVDERLFETFLQSNGCADPDLMIRTSGEFRLSNFLLWQMAYTELFFVDKFWPQLTQADLASVIRQFAQRSRRFGK